MPETTQDRYGDHCSKSLTRDARRWPWEDLRDIQYSTRLTRAMHTARTWRVPAADPLCAQVRPFPIQLSDCPFRFIRAVPWPTHVPGHLAPRSQSCCVRACMLSTRSLGSSHSSYTLLIKPRTAWQQVELCLSLEDPRILTADCCLWVQ